MKKTGYTILLLSVLVIAFSSAIVVSAFIDSFENSLNNLEEVKDKVLVSEYNLDEVQVSYYHHMINGILVKQDYLQVTCNKKTGKVEEVEKHWTPIDVSTLYTPKELVTLPVEKENVLWMQPVMFAKRNDLSYFYQIYEPKEFPLRCWEIRLNTGETILVDETGEQIGSGIPSPYNGMTLSGYASDAYPDYWAPWRYNANSWFSKWCDSYVTLSLPTLDTISTHVSNPDNKILYEIAHSGGEPTRFQANAPDVYYTANRLENDMNQRTPYTFALLCSCEAMRDTGPGTLSYEFRKGEMQDTVTIGYKGMESCPGWSVSLEWQDYLFYAMNAGNTVKDAFDLACLEYPTIADCVVFVGDPNVIIFDDDDDDDDDEIGIPPNIFVSYPKQHAVVAGIVNITGSADDLDGNVDHIFLQIDDGDWIEVTAESVWEYAWDTTTVDDGAHLITVVAVDDTGLSSGCKYVHVNVSNAKVSAAIQCNTEVSVGEKIQFHATVTGGVPPYSFYWDFGDGNQSNIIQPEHYYETPGEYKVVLTVSDVLNQSCSSETVINVISIDATPPSISMIKPKNAIYISDTYFCSFPLPVIIGPISFQVNVTDAEKSIDEVLFSLNGKKYCTFSQPPYEYTWNEPTFGLVTFQCTANDTANNMNTTTLSLFKLF